MKGFLKAEHGVVEDILGQTPFYGGILNVIKWLE